MTATQHKEQVNRERARHHAALAALAASLGVVNPDGLSLWRKLSKIERRAHQAATDYCNGVVDSDEIEAEGARVAGEVSKVFGGVLPPKFRFNLDARGYALKLASSDNGSQPATPFDLHQDWGRNQILAPTID